MSAVEAPACGGVDGVPCDVAVRQYRALGQARRSAGWVDTPGVIQVEVERRWIVLSECRTLAERSLSRARFVEGEDGDAVEGGAEGHRRVR